jgi:hypothetical protein
MWCTGDEDLIITGSSNGHYEALSPSLPNPTLLPTMLPIGHMPQHRNTMYAYTAIRDYNIDLEYKIYSTRAAITGYDIVSTFKVVCGEGVYVHCRPIYDSFPLRRSIISHEYMQRGVDDCISEQFVHLLCGMDCVKEHILVGIFT